MFTPIRVSDAHAYNSLPFYFGNYIIFAYWKLKKWIWGLCQYFEKIRRRFSDVFLCHILVFLVKTCEKKLNIYERCILKLVSYRYGGNG